jgi:type IV secretion system protein VirD4
VLFAPCAAIYYFAWRDWTGMEVMVGTWLFGTVAIEATLKRFGWNRTAALGTLALKADDPLAAVRKACAGEGGGPFLGITRSGNWAYSRPERAVLLLGPPRSGKTSAVIVPAIISHTGPVVATSTKPDVANATVPARGRFGRLWVFDPTGNLHAGEKATDLRWSPVPASASWEGALLMARSMTSAAGVGEGTTHGSHWAKRSQALLAPFLHAAALDGRDIEAVLDWVMRHELDEAGVLLEQERASRLAFGSLVGILNTEERERASIFSAAADALQAYNSEAALEAGKDPNFSPDEFVASEDTLHVCAPADAQAGAAPIVCGLLSEIRRATYQAFHQQRLPNRVLFALDEVANIAPLDELPQIASEGGGQGLILLAALQDLSQARGRWGKAADGFLTLFGTKVILPGIADQTTLETVSTALGEYDRRMISTSKVPNREGWMVPTHTVSTQRTRVLSPGEVANIPAGHALHLDGVRWQLLTAAPAHSTEPWKTLTHPTQQA